MRAPARLIVRVAPKDVTVLFTGESGVGKDVCAPRSTRTPAAPTRRSFASTRRPFPASSPRASSSGTRRERSPGRTQARQGFFQQADRGTLFIDEIGDLPLAMQAKILRALQSGEVQQVGGRTEKVDVRLVTATNRDLAAEAKAGPLPRGSLLPAERRPDPRSAAPRAPGGHRAARPRVRPRVLRSLRNGAGRNRARPHGGDKAHAWPGNVRELENTVARLLAIAPDERLSLALWRTLAEPTLGRRRAGVDRRPRTESPAPREGRGLRARDHRRAVRGRGEEPERDRAAPRRLAARAHREAPQVWSLGRVTRVTIRSAPRRTRRHPLRVPTARRSRSSPRVPRGLALPVDDRSPRRDWRSRRARRSLAVLRLPGRRLDPPRGRRLRRPELRGHPRAGSRSRHRRPRTGGPRPLLAPHVARDSTRISRSPSRSMASTRCSAGSAQRRATRARPRPSSAPCTSRRSAFPRRWLRAPPCARC